MITEMKPWYGNYCFAKESLGRDSKMFNCDMVFYYLCESVVEFNSFLSGYEQNTNYANYTNKGLHCNQLLLSYFSPVGKINKRKIVTHNTSVPPFAKRASDFY